MSFNFNGKMDEVNLGLPYSAERVDKMSQPGGKDLILGVPPTLCGKKLIWKLNFMEMFQKSMKVDVGLLFEIARWPNHCLER